MGRAFGLRLDIAFIMHAIIGSSWRERNHARNWEVLPSHMKYIGCCSLRYRYQSVPSHSIKTIALPIMSPKRIGILINSWQIFSLNIPSIIHATSVSWSISRIVRNERNNNNKMRGNQQDLHTIELKLLENSTTLTIPNFSKTKCECAAAAAVPSFSSQKEWSKWINNVLNNKKTHTLFYKWITLQWINVVQLSGNHSQNTLTLTYEQILMNFGEYYRETDRASLILLLPGESKPVWWWQKRFFIL